MKMKDYAGISEILKAIAHPVRIEIIENRKAGSAWLQRFENPEEDRSAAINHFPTP
jgi:DNA-binding transcriptional ArsR family regulator